MPSTTKSSSSRLSPTEQSPLLPDPDTGEKKGLPLPGDGGNLEPAVEREVRILCLCAVLSGMLLMTVSPMVLTYFIYVGYSTSNNVSFFVIVSAIESAIPIVSHAGIGALTSYIGVRRTLCCIGINGIIMMAVMAYARNARWIFAAGYAIFCMSRSIFVTRMVRMAEIVPGNHRTRTMAYMTFCSLFGGTIGPVIWIVCSQFPGDYHIISSFYLNRFTLDFFAASLICVLITILSWYGLGDSSSVQPQPPVPLDSEDNTPAYNSTQTAVPIPENDDGIDVDDDFVDVNLSDGTHYRVNTKSHQRNVFLYFLYLRFGVAVVTGLTSVAFQPILESKYHTTGQAFGVIYMCVCAIGLIPPLLVAFLSKRLQDRQLLVIGLTIKLIGVSLCLPIFDIGGEIYRWQVVMGLVLVYKGSMFFWTSATSLFTILMGPMTNGAFLGGLSSASSVGPAVSQLFLAHWVINLFGSFRYSVLLIPILLAIFIVVSPTLWRGLDPRSEYIKILIEKMEALEGKRKKLDAKKD